MRRASRSALRLALHSALHLHQFLDVPACLILTQTVKPHHTSQGSFTRMSGFLWWKALVVSHLLPAFCQSLTCSLLVFGAIFIGSWSNLDALSWSILLAIWT